MGIKINRNKNKGGAGRKVTIGGSTRKQMRGGGPV